MQSLSTHRCADAVVAEFWNNFLLLLLLLSTFPPPPVFSYCSDAAVDLALELKLGVITWLADMFMALCLLAANLRVCSPKIKRQLEAAGPREGVRKREREREGESAHLIQTMRSVLHCI